MAWRLDISAALKGQEKLAQGRVEGEARSGALGHGHPRKGTLKGCNTPIVLIVVPFQGGDDPLGSQPRAALRASPSTLPWARLWRPFRPLDV